MLASVNNELAKKTDDKSGISGISSLVMVSKLEGSSDNNTIVTTTNSSTGTEIKTFTKSLI